MAECGAGTAHKGMLGSDDPEWGALSLLGKCPVGKEVCPRSWSDNLESGCPLPGRGQEHLAPEEESSGNMFKLQKPRPHPQRV